MSSIVGHRRRRRRRRQFGAPTLLPIWFDGDGTIPLLSSRALLKCPELVISSVGTYPRWKGCFLWPCQCHETAKYIVDASACIYNLSKSFLGYFFFSFSGTQASVVETDPSSVFRFGEVCKSCGSIFWYYLPARHVERWLRRSSDFKVQQDSTLCTLLAGCVLQSGCRASHSGTR